MAPTGKHVFTLHKKWCGDTSSVELKAYTPTGHTIVTHAHRLKVDERNGFLLMTYSEPGGLHTTDLITGDILWVLPRVCAIPLFNSYWILHQIPLL